MPFRTVLSSYCIPCINPATSMYEQLPFWVAAELAVFVELLLLKHET